jgi:nucleoside-diphosphate-sugar epimerase
MSDSGWAEAAGGCDFVLHLASPFPPGVPKHEDDLIIPAREGALRLLRAARDAGVRRVVLTSSFAAIGYGHHLNHQCFTEESWTDPDNREITAYVKSKTLAERAAWDFIAREGGALELSVVNPVGVFGPVLGPDYSASIQLVQRLLDGGLPGSPRMSINIVDVCDVADLHLRAMTQPAARGERFLVVAGDGLTMQQVAQLLRARMGSAAVHIPSGVLPDWMIKLAALFDPAIAQIVPELGMKNYATHEKATPCLAGRRERMKRRSSRRPKAWFGLGCLRFQILRVAPMNRVIEQ